jgi:hypothetical protein
MKSFSKFINGFCTCVKVDDEGVAEFFVVRITGKESIPGGMRAVYGDERASLPELATPVAKGRGWKGDFTFEANFKSKGVSAGDFRAAVSVGLRAINDTQKHHEKSTCFSASSPG